MSSLHDYRKAFRRPLGSNKTEDLGSADSLVIKMAFPVISPKEYHMKFHLRRRKSETIGSHNDPSVLVQERKQQFTGAPSIVKQESLSEDFHILNPGSKNDCSSGNSNINSYGYSTMHRSSETSPSSSSTLGSSQHASLHQLLHQPTSPLGSSSIDDLSHHRNNAGRLPKHSIPAMPFATSREESRSVNQWGHPSLPQLSPLEKQRFFETELSPVECARFPLTPKCEQHESLLKISLDVERSPSPKESKCGGGKTKKTREKKERKTRKKKGDGSDDNKTPQKPKRPFSAYNLFFQLEREYINQAVNKKNREDGGEGKEEDTIGPMDSNIPERYTQVRLEEHWFRAGLKTKRKHRKTEGSVGFIELTRMISSRWATVDPEIKEYCKKIADEELEHYRKEIEKYKVSMEKEESEKTKRSSDEASQSTTSETDSLQIPPNHFMSSNGAHMPKLSDDASLSSDISNPMMARAMSGLPPPPFLDGRNNMRTESSFASLSETQARKRMRSTQYSASTEEPFRQQAEQYTVSNTGTSTSSIFNSGITPQYNSHTLAGQNFYPSDRSFSRRDNYAEGPEATSTKEEFDREVERFLNCLGQEIKENHRSHNTSNGMGMNMDMHMNSIGNDREHQPFTHCDLRPADVSSSLLPEFKWD